MPSKVFKLPDRPYFARVLDDCLSQSGLDEYELGLAIQTTGNKQKRAASIVRHLFENVQDTDAAVINLLNYLFVESVDAEPRKQEEAFQRLETNVLQLRGVHLTEDGYVIAGEPHAPAQIDPLPTSKSPWVSATNQSDSNPTSTFHPWRTEPVTTRSQTDVFVVRGRDTRPVDAVETFLHFLGLRMLSWTDAVELTGQPQPHTFDVVKAGMDAAAAIIVIFSPDDEARTKEVFQSPHESPEPVMGQARQNVLLEAGMAFGYARERTIFVQSAHTRPISDIEGFNWVPLDGSWERRQDLLNRLRAAGAKVNPKHENLQHRLAGEFKAF